RPGVELRDMRLAAQLFQAEQSEEAAHTSRWGPVGRPELGGVLRELVLGIEPRAIPVHLRALDRVGDIAVGNSYGKTERDARRPDVKVRLLAIPQRLDGTFEHGLEK